MNRTTNNGLTNALVLAAGLAATAAPALAINVTVPRSRSGLQATTQVNKAGGGMLTIGMRGDAPTHDATKQAWIAVWEADSDDRRTNLAGASNQNGFAANHPFLRGNFLGDGVRDFAVDGNAAPAAGHATGVAGIILSTHGTNRGMASRARGVVGLHDDLARVFYAGGGRHPSPTAAADWTQMKASGDWLNAYPANVFNVSTGYANKPNPNFGTPGQLASVPIVQGDLNGSSYPTKLIDFYAHTSDRVMVVAAGNEGTSNGGLLTYPGDNFNGITVGALAQVGATGVAQVASYSSYQPLASNRNGVHIVAPGTQITSANFNHQKANPNFVNIGNGTSFATPHVAGAAAVLWSAAEQGRSGGGVTDKGDSFDNDHKLIKAVLLNGADKIPGSRAGGGGGQPTVWTPGRVDAADATRWLNPLNYVVGAGELNANEAWKTMREASWEGAGDNAKSRFWDIDTITSSTTSIGYRTDLYDDFSLESGHWITSLTATLTWDRHVVNPALAAPGLSDLDLRLQVSLDGGDTWTNLLSSVSVVDSTEHVYLTGLGRQGDGAIYQLLVENYSLAAGITSEEYALAVSYTSIPAPGAAALLGLAGLLAAERRRSREA